MQYHLPLIVFSIWYLAINVQSQTTSAVHIVVESITVTTTTTTTTIPTTERVKETPTTTTLNTPIATVAIVANKAFTFVYDEPPPHPLGYCVRSRLRCLKIRRCCNGPCDVNQMKCP